MRNTILILLFVHIFPWVAFADNEDNYNYTYYQIENGLCDEYVLSTYKDKDGFIWMCTSNGLDRFDGNTFVHYNTHSVDPATKINSDFIYAVIEDDYSHIWGVSSLGLFRINKKENTVSYFHELELENAKLLSSPMTNIAWGRTGNMWICAKNKILNIELDQEGEISAIHSIDIASSFLIRYIFVQGDKVWIGGNKGVLCFNKLLDSTIASVDLSCYPAFNDIKDVTTIYAYGYYLWVGTAYGLFCYNLQSKILKSYYHQMGNSNSLSDNHVTCITMNHSGDMLIGTTSGLDYYSHDGGFNHISQGRPNHSLNTNYVNHIMVDENHYIWISTLVGGVNLLTPKRILFDYELNTTNSKTNVVSCSYQDSENNVLIGVLGKGLGIKLAGSNDFKFYSLKEIGGFSQDDIFVICQDYNKNYWLASRNDGLILLKKQDLRSPKFTNFSVDNSTISSNFIYDLIPDPLRKGLWLCSNEAIEFMNVSTCTFQKLTIDDDIEAHHTIFLDSKNRLWVGGYGVCVINLTSREQVTGKYAAKCYRYKLDNPHTRIAERISSIVETADGEIFIGSQNNGVYTIEEEYDTEYTFKSIPFHYGYSHNRISKLLKDNNGDLWIGSADGIYHYDTTKKLSVRFDKTDGLPSSQCYINSGSLFNNGDVCFGTINGLVIFKSPFNVQQEKERSVKITGIVNMNLLAEKDNTQINIYPDIPSFDVYYSALDYYNPKSIIYAYKIDELDKEWNIASQLGYVRYNNLSPGKYTFRIRCTNIDNSWSTQESVLHINMHPRFYQTIWFSIFIFAIIIIIILLYIYQYVRTQRQVRRLLTKEVEERTKSLTDTLRDLTASRDAINEQSILLQVQNKEIREQKNRIESYSAQMDRVNKEKLMLFTNLTHEFKTPLTLILGPISNLVTNIKDPKLLSPIQIIERNAKYLLSLVNQIIDLRKVDANKMVFNQEEFDILSLLNVYMADYFSVLSERHIEYQMLTHLQYCHIKTDRGAVYKIISNLISNAVKYTPVGGRIKIYIAQYRLLGNQITQYMSFENTGSYIKESEIDNIFQCFYKVQGQQSFSCYGENSTGIGLYLVRQLVEALGGKICVKSSAKTGTCFRFFIPVEPIEESSCAENIVVNNTDMEEVPQAEYIPFLPSDDKKKPVLLLVEDNIDMRTYIKSFLSEFYSVAEAVNGERGYDMAKRIIPDFIISDLMMPVCDGIEFCKNIRQDESLSHIPFLMLTALSSDIARFNSYKQGVDAFLTKPFEQQMLITRIENILNNRKQKQSELTFDLTNVYAKVDIEKKDEVFMGKVLDIMKNNYADSEFGVTELQAQLGMSSTPFYKKIAVLTGLTPSHFIRLYRLQTAKKIIESHIGDRGVSVSEIAYMVGFNDPKYFSRCFINQYNVLPSDILQSLKE